MSVHMVHESLIGIYLSVRAIRGAASDSYMSQRQSQLRVRARGAWVGGDTVVRSWGCRN